MKDRNKLIKAESKKLLNLCTNEWDLLINKDHNDTQKDLLIIDSHVVNDKDKIDCYDKKDIYMK